MAEHYWSFDEDSLPPELEDTPFETAVFKGHKIETSEYDGDIFGVIDDEEYQIGWARDGYHSVEDLLECNPHLVKELGAELAQIVAEYVFYQESE